MSENRHVFISYSSKDIDYVMQLVRAMEASNIPYWRAPDRIPAGSNYAKEIPRAIRECSLFLLVYSRNSQESIWVEKELDTAVCCKKKILPVVIDDCEFNELFRFYLNNVQMFRADIGQKQILNVKAIVEAVRNITQNINEEKVVSENVRKESVVKENVNVLEEGTVRRRSVDKRSNALRINRIPLECEYCGGGVQLKSIGVYVCVKCGRENYDDFNKVRNYLEQHGPAPAVIIAKHTGVSRASIEHFINS